MCMGYFDLSRVLVKQTTRQQPVCDNFLNAMKSRSSLWTSLQKYNAFCLIVLATLTPILSIKVPFSPKSQLELSSAVRTCLSAVAKDSTTPALVALDTFCHRQFNDPENSFPDNKIRMPKDDFMGKLSEQIARLGGSKALVEGYLHGAKKQTLTSSIIDSEH